MTALLLALARTLPLAWLALAPVGGVAVRLLVGAVLVLAVLPAMPSEVALGPALAHELAVGGALGLVASVPLVAAQAAGLLVDHARRPDVERDAYATLGRWSALALFAAVGGPRLWLGALAESYAALPIGRGLPPGGLTVVLGAGARLIGGAVTLAAPVLVALLAGELVVGLVARSAPRLRLGVAPAAREVVALAAVALTAGTAAATLGRGVGALGQDLLDAIRALAG